MQCLRNILKHANFHQMDRNDYHVFLVYINTCLWNLSLTWDFIVGNQAPFAEFPKCVINIYARFFQNSSCKLWDMNDLVNVISFIFAKKGIWITTMLYFYIFSWELSNYATFSLTAAPMINNTSLLHRNRLNVSLISWWCGHNNIQWCTDWITMLCILFENVDCGHLFYSHEQLTVAQFHPLETFR